MPAFKFGDIVLVRFHPAYGKELKKYRPAVVVSTRVGEVDERFVLIAPLTSGAKAKNEFEIAVDHQVLTKTSNLLCWYLRTTDIQRVVRRLGELKREDALRVRKTITKLFL